MLVDTSVWVDHFRRRNERLASLLLRARVLCHPFVVGELACGNLRRRSEILSLLKELPQAPVLDHQEVLTFVETQRLMGCGIGWIDAHLLSSAMLAAVSLWTLDRRLRAAARRLGVHSAP